MNDALHLCSLVVHARADALARVCSQIDALEGAQVHATSPHGKLVVTIEGASDAALLANIDRIGRFDGVLAATLVYQHCDAGGEPASQPSAET